MNSTLNQETLNPDTNLGKMKSILDNLYNVETVLTSEGLDPSVPLSQVTLTQAIKSVQVARDLASKLVDAERRLEYMENMALTMINAAPIAIIIVDQNDTIHLWNSAATEMYGWEPLDAIGRQLSETIIPERFRELHKAGMKRFIETRGFSQVLNRPIRAPVMHQDGTEFEAELLIGPIMTQGVLLFLAFSRSTAIPREVQSPSIVNLLKQEIL